MNPVRGRVLVVVTLALFAMWSNSFIAIGYLLGSDGAPARFDWIGLTVARLVPAGLVCGAYCIVFRRREMLELLRGHWRRLAICGAMAVPGYNSALYYGQQHGVPAPIASLTTTLVPLFVMLLAAALLSERMTARRVAGFAVAACGMALIASAKRDAGVGYPVLIGITALAPLCWSIYSIASKPMTDRVSPVVWTYTATALGTVSLLPFLPGRVWTQWAALDATGWMALMYLSIPCTVVGFAIWTWLLRHLPASTVGFTVFLNPPSTTLSKWMLSAAFPATFAFAVRPLEWIGGAVTLTGLAVAIFRRPRPAAGRTAARGDETPEPLR